MGAALYIAKLSHENFSLAFSEFNSILWSDNIHYKILLNVDEFILFEAPKQVTDVLTKRAAQMIELGEFIDIINVDKEFKTIIKIIKDFALQPNTCIDVDSIKGFGKNAAKELVQELPIGVLCNRRRHEDTETLKVTFIENVALIYRLLYRRRQSMYIDREPHLRPCYRPGTMKPLLARTFVNLAKVSSLKNEVVLDPFCGVGGLTVEACLMGLRAICGDIDRAMVLGAKCNTEWYGCSGAIDIIEMDACFNAIAHSRVDGIATDPPYGIQSSPRGRGSLEHLIIRFIENAHSILRKGRYMVFAIPITISKNIEKVLIRTGYEIAEKHIDKVHSSLTRVIYVAKKL